MQMCINQKNEACWVLLLWFTIIVRASQKLGWATEFITKELTRLNALFWEDLKEF